MKHSRFAEEVIYKGSVRAGGGVESAILSITFYYYECSLWLCF